MQQEVSAINSHSLQFDMTTCVETKTFGRDLSGSKLLIDGVLCAMGMLRQLSIGLTRRLCAVCHSRKTASEVGSLGEDNEPVRGRTPSSAIRSVRL